MFQLGCAYTSNTEERQSLPEVFVANEFYSPRFECSPTLEELLNTQRQTETMARTLSLHFTCGERKNV